MSININTRVEDGCQVTEINPVIKEEPSIYNLQFLVYRLDLQREYKLSDLETKVISFILSYANVSEKFYFGNESLGKIFDKSAKSISRSISILCEKGLVSIEVKLKSGGGQIRFVRVGKNVYSMWTKMSTLYGQKCLQSNNKVNKNKINKGNFNNSFNKNVDNLEENSKEYRNKVDSEYKRTVDMLNKYDK